MTSDERNFRSTYYEKVGCRSVEEKKSLEILLKERILDRAKLKQFCLRFSVPASYRNLIWKLLLGVVPMYVECHQFIMDQRRQEVTNLSHALKVMRVADDNTPKPQLFLAMWLLQTGNLKHNVNFRAENGFVLIVQSLLQFFEDDTDIYWLAKSLYDCVRKFECDIPKLVEFTVNMLEKEDNSLYKHFEKIGFLRNLPLEKWYGCCFAGVLNETALGKIWDKLCGGSYKILVFVAFVLLTNQRHRLMKCTNVSSVLSFIKNIPEETAEVIANKSVEMWQQHGSPLTVHDKPKP